MEFDIGTLIYIVITIIAIVAGVAGKKKTPAGSSDGSGDGSSKSFFDKLEEQLTGFADEAKETAGSFAEEIKAPFTGDQYVVEREVAADDRREQDKTYWQNNIESAYDEYAGIYDPDQQDELEQISEEAIRSTDESDMLQVEELDESEHPDYFEIVNEFDLGTAVVYSTIINRKEY
ncbi:MAG: hypothetical protein P1P82_01780 [Bacteroidales bacterium]|nr:hypothetical protein [Bacteroidales bacterium]MDT8430275.1 hypothetical protein [Bacteroidales bacterium]